MSTSTRILTLTHLYLSSFGTKQVNVFIWWYKDFSTSPVSQYLHLKLADTLSTWRRNSLRWMCQGIALYLWLLFWYVGSFKAPNRVHTSRLIATPSPHNKSLNILKALWICLIFSPLLTAWGCNSFSIIHSSFKTSHTIVITFLLVKVTQYAFLLKFY